MDGVPGTSFIPEMVPLSALRSHPRNYREHPDDQLEHLMESLREHGVYRNILIARDNTILAGHGLVMAAGRLGLQELPAIRLPLDPEEPRALKVLAADNELAQLAETDSQALVDLLREVQAFDVSGLLGTGHDAQSLAALVMGGGSSSPGGGTRAGTDASGEWQGMPGFEQEDQTAAYRAIVHFASEEDMQAFERLVGQHIPRNTRAIWYPAQERARFREQAYSEAPDGA